MCQQDSCENKNNPYASFGNKILRAREALEMTREEVARRLGLDALFYEKIEQGEIEATDQLKRELIHILGINL